MSHGLNGVHGGKERGGQREGGRETIVLLGTASISIRSRWGSRPVPKTARRPGEWKRRRRRTAEAREASSCAFLGYTQRSSLGLTEHRACQGP